MVTRDDIRKKTPDELLQMYITQKDYLPEVVAMVKAEIEERKIDVSAVHVITQLDIDIATAAVETKRKRGTVRFTAVCVIVVGIVVAISAFFVGLLKEHDVTSLAPIALGLVLAYFGYAIWRLKIWALWAGAFLFSFAFVWNVCLLLLLSPGEPETAIFKTIFTGCSAAACIYMARRAKQQGQALAQRG